MTGVSSRAPGTDTTVAPDDDAAVGALPPSGSRAGWLPKYLWAGGLYLLASLGLWWHMWTGGPSSVMTCACTDAGRMVWYVEWSQFALAHGHNLLFSTWLLHPTGVNLLADTSVPAMALVLTPVTSLFGPVAAVNAAATLTPVLAALSMFWLLQRWVSWQPAAFVGGLFFGFSTSMVVQLAFGWLNLACTVLLPLVVGCLDELLIRQRVPPVRVGVGLGLLLTVQFFLSSELLLITVVSVAMAVVVLVAYGAVRDPARLRQRARPATLGLGTAVVTSGVLLAYPVWFFLAGPAHLGTTVWSTNVPGTLGNSFSNFWSHLGLWGPVGAQSLASQASVLGGYRGAALPSPAYLGPGLLVVVVAGAIWWRRDRRLQFFGVLGVLAAALSLRVGGGRWGPWALVDHLPLFRNVVQSRFSAVVGLCAAVMLAVIVDRSRSAVLSWPAARADGPDPAPGPARPAWFATAGAMLVVAVALVPVAAVLAPNIPLTVQPVSVPHWFETAAVRLPPAQVVLTYPFATADSQAAIPWQAIDRMHYQMAGSGGPAGTAARAGANRAAFLVLRSASVTLLPAPTLSLGSLEAVRQAMRDWGVTIVVVPDDAGLPAYLTARGTPYGVAFFTAVLGSSPAHRDGAWVWVDPAHAPPPVPVATPVLDACLTRHLGGPAEVARCVVRSGGRPGGGAR